MKPIKFDECNVVYGANQPEYEPLPAELIPGPSGQITTCWQLTPEEIEEVQRTGKIWISVLTFGTPLQPILLTTNRPEKHDN